AAVAGVFARPGARSRLGARTPAPDPARAAGALPPPRHAGRPEDGVPARLRRRAGDRRAVARTALGRLRSPLAGRLGASVWTQAGARPTGGAPARGGAPPGVRGPRRPADRRARLCLSWPGAPR